MLANDLFLSIALSILAFSSNATIQGVVREAGSLEPISHATVRIALLDRTVLTDQHGYFVIAGIPDGNWDVEAHSLGYRAHSVTVLLSSGGTARIELELEPQPVALPAVEVTVPRVSASDESPLSVGGLSGPSAIRIDPSVVERMPALAEPDVFRAIQMLPSVQTGSDFSSALYVRGGLPDQNLLLLDGAPLFNPYHLGGIFSAFDPEAIRAVEILPGAFPPSVGDRLSSAINVQTRDGGRDQMRGSGSLGLVSSRLSLDGPLPGGKGSFLFSGRRTYLDLAADAAYRLKLTNSNMPYAFSDGHLKLTHDIGSTGKLSASAYLNQEAFSIPDSRLPEGVQGFPDAQQADLDWGSRVFSVQYRQAFWAAGVVDFRGGVSGSHGDLDWRDWDRDRQTGELSDEPTSYLAAATRQRDLFMAADFSWHRSTTIHRAGVQFDRYLFDHTLGSDDFSGQASSILSEFERHDRPQSFAAYVGQEWTATPTLSLRGGMRLLHAGARGTEWLPRVGLRFAATRNLSLSAGLSRTAQVVRSIRNDESLWSSVTAFDLLSGVNSESGLATATDVTVGAEWSRGSSSVRIDAFTKRLNDLAIGSPLEDPMNGPILLPESGPMGRGSAHGLEMLAHHSRGESMFSLAYALTFAELELDGVAFRPRFERRHILDATASVPWGDAGIFSGRFAVASGQSTTPILGMTQPVQYDPVQQHFEDSYGVGYIMGDHNSDRLPMYVRFDVGARRTFDREWFGHEITFTPYLNVLNILNFRNVLIEVPERSGFITSQPQLPILPTFGIDWTF